MLSIVNAKLRTYFEVLQEINSIKNKKSCGYDNVP